MQKNCVIDGCSMQEEVTRKIMLKLTFNIWESAASSLSKKFLCLCFVIAVLLLFGKSNYFLLTQQAV